MHIYSGFGPESGKVIEGDANALAYACTACGVMPLNCWQAVDPDFADMMLEWFYSGNWVKEERGS